MSIYHKGEKITDYYKLEDEIGRYCFPPFPTIV